ncbi:hypothetical protein ACFFU1_16595 [Algibacter miyuki]|uniref:YozE SAM-like domain-containing protein n=1 Tax=Algibacter miyuki TaxID=1306933 RepID=A0ABV5H3P3_9FLAO|nr:hypothetical protein [Algibacter miyuki]MDN3665598.1 hypothetical protein [Algibacter miyuki]
MTLRQFITHCSSYNSPIGDLANDILDKKANIKGKSEKEILQYLEFETSMGGTEDVYKEFLTEYKKLNY